VNDAPLDHAAAGAAPLGGGAQNRCDQPMPPLKGRGTLPPAGPVVAPRRARRRRQRRHIVREVLALNLTPMLDCVFNVLLFLIVVTRFATPEGTLPAKLPAKGAAVARAEGFEVPREPVRLYLSADPARAEGCLVRIDDKTSVAVPRAELIGRLRSLLQQPGYDSRTPVYLLADDRVRWDDVVNAYNAALAASFQRIFFAGS